jgi:hypothetical protein
MGETFGVRPIQDLSRGEIASYLDMLEAQSGGMRSLRFQPGQTSPYSREDLQNQLNVLTETQRVLATGNRPFLGMEGDLPGSLAVQPAPGGFSPGMGMPEQAPLRPGDRQPTPPLAPVQERVVRPTAEIVSVPQYQPPPQAQPAAILPAPVPAPQQASVAPSSGVSGNTLLGLAALTDAFAILGGRQPTMLAQMAPIAQQRSQQQALSQIIAQRMQGNLTPQQATLLGNAVQQAATGAQTQAAPAAPGEVPVLRTAPGQDPQEVRGVRTNNPLNLSFANQPNAIGTDGRFAVFQTPEEGVAASVRQLQLYGQRGLNTIDQIVSRWAPPSENNTPAYIQAVAQRVGVSPNQEIDLSDPNIMRRLVNAMSVQEVGRVIPEDVLQRGVDLGFQPPQQRQQPSLTPTQAQITAPTPAAPSSLPGVSLRPRGVSMTPELAATLQALPPGEALKLLTQLDLQAAQQRGARALTNTEAQAYFASLGSPQLYDPNKVYQVTQDGGISVVPGTRESEQPTRQQQVSLEGELRTQFGAQKPVQEFLQMGPQIRAIRDGVARETPSRLNDINLTFAFAKMLDPTSVVRENEAGQIVASASVMDRLGGFIARLNGGAAFSPELRAQLLREAESRYSSAREAYDVEADAYRDLARGYGVEPGRVIPPRRDLPEARPIPGSQQAQSNAVPEAQRPAVVAELTNRIQSGALTQQAARELARQLGIPNAERLFQ